MQSENTVHDSLNLALGRLKLTLSSKNENYYLTEIIQVCSPVAVDKAIISNFTTPVRPAESFMFKWIAVIHSTFVIFY